MSQTPETAESTSVVRGWTLAWHSVLLLVLVVATGNSIADSSVKERLAVIVIAGLLAGWWALIVCRERVWESPAPQAAAMLGVAGALWVPLLLSDPVFK